MSPLRNPNTNQETGYNVVHTRTRTFAERAKGIWIRHFPVLQDPIRMHLDDNFVIIVTAAVLHNIALPRDKPYSMMHIRKMRMVKTMRATLTIAKISISLRQRMGRRNQKKLDRILI